MWARRPADFDGPFTTLHQAHLGVPPVTAGGPPVWVGGHSDAALRRTLHFGDGSYGTGADAAEVADGLGRLAEAGLTACTLWLPVAAEHVEKAMKWVAAEVAPRLT
ncbi:LLM class flavin-dependent oxidoreductase [Streptomyces sp. NPDC047000]|uniref:LLM class flavin-dependent oxidoreductase n=1 Tax=Streptomyces sp. NPDC047000 TaxID=3155474 RepID=UPI0033E126DC